MNSEARNASRTVLTVLMAGIFLSSYGISAAGAESPKDRAKWRMATRAAARQVFDDAENAVWADGDTMALLEKTLTDAIGNNVAEHVTRQESQERCRTLIQAACRSAIESSLKTAVNSASEHSPLPVSPADVRTALGENWLQQTEAAVAHFTDEHVTNLFAEARSTAVAVLWQQIQKSAVLPPQGELDQFIDQQVAKRPPLTRLNDEDWSALRGWLENHTIPSNQPLLEEVRVSANEITDQLLLEIRNQYKAQLTAVEKATKSSSTRAQVRATEIEKTITDHVREAINQRRANRDATDRPLYAPLACVKRAISELARNLETRQFMAFIKESDILELSPERVADQIREALPQCRTTSKSEEYLTKALQNSTPESLATAYAKQHNTARETTYFTGLLTQDGPLRNEFVSYIADQLSKTLPAARERITEEQFSHLFPSLQESTPLAKTLIVKIASGRVNAASKLSEAIQLLQDGGYRELQETPETKLLEETEQRVVDFANQQIASARNALKSQSTLLKKLEKERLDSLKKRIATGASVKDLSREWLAVLHSQWEDTIAQTPSIYDELLEPTRKDLDKTLRQFFDSITKELKEQPTEVSKPTEEEGSREEDLSDEIRQDPAQSEELVKEDAGDEQAEKTSEEDQGENISAAKILSTARATAVNQPDAILLLTDQDDAGLVATLITTASGNRCSARFDPADAEAAANAVFDVLQPQLTDLLNQNASRWSRGRKGFLFFGKRSQPKLKLFVVIASDDVRHRTSLFLRTRIEEKLVEWAAHQEGLPAPELDWKVGLGYAPVEE